VLATVLLAGGVGAPTARADGDPASDVLVSQTLYLPADAGVSEKQEMQLNAVLRALKRSGVPVRVAVIPSAYDLGSIGELWLKPATYARFLGIELSLVYKQALLVVMPNGFGLNWPGHSSAAAEAHLANIRIGAGTGAVVTATEAAVRAVAASDGVAIASSPRTGGGRGAEAIATIGGAVAGLLATGAALRLALRRRRRDPALPAPTNALASERRSRRRRAVPGIAAACCVAIGTPILVVSLVRQNPASPGRHRPAAVVGHRPAAAVGHRPATVVGHRPAVSITAAANAAPPALAWRAGKRSAPDFRLADENGRPVSTAAYRGRPFIVTFIDPLCRNLCPLAAQVLDQADRQLPAARRVPIVAVSVDIYADTHADLTQDFKEWRLVPQWRWAVGAPRQLAEVWKRWDVGVWVETKRIAGTTVHYITHNEFAFLVDPAGYERALFIWPYGSQGVVDELDRLSRS
jgi:cytochrome oxidase Cu insertion factor (SCO1/SenC/PrrC family)